MTEHVAELLDLSVEERLEIVGDLWDSIANDSEKLELSQELKDELDCRYDDYLKNPDEGVSWEELNKRLAESR